MPLILLNDLKGAVGCAGVAVEFDVGIPALSGIAGDGIIMRDIEQTAAQRGDTRGTVGEAVAVHSLFQQAGFFQEQFLGAVFPIAGLLAAVDDEHGEVGELGLMTGIDRKENISGVRIVLHILYAVFRVSGEDHIALQAGCGAGIVDILRSQNRLEGSDLVEGVGKDLLDRKSVG